jgi:hypothetical protein
VYQHGLALPEVRPAVEREVRSLVGDVERRRRLEGHRLRHWEDQRRRDGYPLGEATLREPGRGEDPQPRFEVHASSDLRDRPRDLGAQGEGEFGSLLVRAPAQEDVEEVQGCSLDLHYDLPRFRRRVFDLLQRQGLFRIPKLAYPRGSHRLLPWASFVGPELTTARRRAGW